MLCDAAFWREQMLVLDDLAIIEVPSFGRLDNFEAMAVSVLGGAPARFALAGHSMGDGSRWKSCAARRSAS